MRPIRRRAAPFVLVLGLSVLLAAACHKHRKPLRPPPPPPRVTMLQDAFVRAEPSDQAPGVANVKKGDIVAVDKVKEKWCHVITSDGTPGYLRRETFSKRTALFGTAGFTYTRYVADQLRHVPALDIIAVETTQRLMPGSPPAAAGGVNGAEQLAGSLKADLVVGVTGGGRQFVYEVVDMKAKTVLLRATTKDTEYIRGALNEMADQIGHLFEPGAKPAGAASATPSATPSPTPEPRHPNAPLPLSTASAAPTATPAASATATGTATPAESPSQP